MSRVLVLLSGVAEGGLAAAATVAGEGVLCGADILYGVVLLLSSVSECSRATSSLLIVVDDDSLTAETAPLKKTCSILLEDFFNFAFGLLMAYMWCGIGIIFLMKK